MKTLPVSLAVLGLSAAASAQLPSQVASFEEIEPAPLTTLPGTRPARTDRVSQAELTSGTMTLKQVRRAGLLMFSTPFTRLDGYGDGPVNALDPTSPGGRPTLQNNGTFLRINGLDSQTCMECHSVGSNAVVPFRFAIAGAGGSNNNAMFQPRDIDVDDESLNGFAFYDGRYINPPFLFGAGGVELAGKEMTQDLQELKEEAMEYPGTPIALVTKGVSFGTITYDDVSGTFDTSNVEGVDDDLVVRPFGRKGDNSSIRKFDIGALQFHFGMQPTEVVGVGVDGDGDGVVDEVTVGELSSMHVFGVTNERPRQRGGNSAQVLAGKQVFTQVGCAGCHVPALQTNSTKVPVAFPEVETDPTQNVFMEIKLTGAPAKFDSNGNGGIVVPLFSDLKRHDMGPALSESFGHELDSQFITARLWGIADTAPYLHDGRALTLLEAINMHGGEAQAVADAFALLPVQSQIDLLAFLGSLRTPLHANEDLVK